METEQTPSVPQPKKIINHVMSRDIASGIFSAIVDYFTQFGSEEFDHIVSVTPLPNAAVYHYHRPHLEEQLLPNSVCTVHHDLNDPDPWHAKFRFIPRYMESAGIVCLNHSQKEVLIQQGLQLERLFVVPHGYNDSVLQYHPKARDKEKITFGIASRRYGRRVKGEAYLLELAKRLDPDYFDFIFVGKDRTFSAIAMRELGYEAKAYERLPYRMFQSFYDEIDVLLMCSSHEGGPANIPEALATGTPIFSSKLGIPKDVIQDGENGLFLTLDADADAERIHEICIDDPAQFQVILDNAHTLPELAITWQQSVEGNLAVYRKIIAGEI
ncbi:glycosyltransferase family 4 protein [Kingella negevensis]|uniref:glycosyltransferase family 4 protein n=1 Tax=Kingella negevensis TaxID=1522312 RepID=UPI0005C79C3B|nr:glycosyltransferase family 4 protein [Kingella negevensis]MDK4679269.1 glycosyltransferase family 4 protein [Kingella negevensis]MDK4683009.1 glycosyltransferase family 4 protein [Kingella negevensis]MDK4688441.1 glycosyltransferase family 4 protein [Kingella negevensis]MDK4691209.1 glycosyltransferase family 4 protein [Kingella negevensis]MDK4693643.1 glycosyltransferase family 4 protein [Kingella negevensis]